jgi:hypothetical protein
MKWYRSPNVGGFTRFEPPPECQTVDLGIPHMYLCRYVGRWWTDLLLLLLLCIQEFNLHSPVPDEYEHASYRTGVPSDGLKIEDFFRKRFCGDRPPKHGYEVA